MHLERRREKGRKEDAWGFYRCGCDVGEGLGFGFGSMDGQGGVVLVQGSAQMNRRKLTGGSGVSAKEMF
jgi:hypothetical protein